MEMAVLPRGHVEAIPSTEGAGVARAAPSASGVDEHRREPLVVRAPPTSSNQAQHSAEEDAHHGAPLSLLELAIYQAVARRDEGGIDTRHQSRHLKSFDHAFSGAQFVDWLLERAPRNKWPLATREACIEFGQKLLDISFMVRAKGIAAMQLMKDSGTLYIWTRTGATWARKDVDFSDLDPESGGVVRHTLVTDHLARAVFTQETRRRERERRLNEHTSYIGNLLAEQRHESETRRAEVTVKQAERVAKVLQEHTAIRQAWEVKLKEIEAVQQARIEHLAECRRKDALTDNNTVSRERDEAREQMVRDVLAATQEALALRETSQKHAHSKREIAHDQMVQVATEMTSQRRTEQEQAMAKQKERELEVGRLVEVRMKELRDATATVARLETDATEATARGVEVTERLRTQAQHLIELLLAEATERERVRQTAVEQSRRDIEERIEHERAHLRANQADDATLREQRQADLVAFLARVEAQVDERNGATRAHVQEMREMREKDGVRLTRLVIDTWETLRKVQREYEERERDRQRTLMDDMRKLYAARLDMLSSLGMARVEQRLALRAEWDVVCVAAVEAARLASAADAETAAALRETAHAMEKERELMLAEARDEELTLQREIARMREEHGERHRQARAAIDAALVATGTDYNDMTAQVRTERLLKAQLFAEELRVNDEAERKAFLEKHEREHAENVRAAAERRAALLARQLELKGLATDKLAGAVALFREREAALEEREKVLEAEKQAEADAFAARHQEALARETSRRAESKQQQLKRTEQVVQLAADTAMMGIGVRHTFVLSGEGASSATHR